MSLFAQCERLKEGLVTQPLQFSIRHGALIELVNRLPPGSIWQAIAIGRDNLPITMVALAMGGNARTGTEDTLLSRLGVPIRSNAELVLRLVDLTTALEREPVSVDEVAAGLGLQSSSAPVGEGPA